MIEIKELKKCFGGFPALDGLNLTVPTGSVYGLVGPNGAGKTTAIKHLTGVYRQDSGDVLLDGEPVFENPKAKEKLAYIPDEIYYFPQAGIRDMAEFYRGVYPGFSEERYRRLLANIQEGIVFSRDGDRIWECSNCGHIVVGPKAPDVCPVCDHPQSYFQLKPENY